MGLMEESRTPREKKNDIKIETGEISLAVCECVLE